MSAPFVPQVSETQPRERRSLFQNYRAAEPPEGSGPAQGGSPMPADGPLRRDPVERVGARSFLHQFLARLFDHPDPGTWRWMARGDTREAVRSSARACGDEALVRAADDLAARLTPGAFEAFRDDYVAAVGHAARGSSPINEIEYGELKADPLFQPHRLADLAAFYRAFGMEVVDDAGERLDHLGVELEFMAVLAAQEGHALQNGMPDEVLRINLDAQRLFLREHLGRWSPTFARRLEAMVGDETLRAAARLLIAFVDTECRHAGIPSGSSDVSLRPADEGAALCDSCGLHQALPGAGAPAAT